MQAQQDRALPLVEVCDWVPEIPRLEQPAIESRCMAKGWGMVELRVVGGVDYEPDWEEVFVIGRRELDCDGPVLEGAPGYGLIFREWCGGSCGSGWYQRVI